MKALKIFLWSTIILVLGSQVFAQTWMPTSAPIANWRSVASSADGSKLAAVASWSYGIYTSTNSGAGWSLTSASLTEDWFSVASSADGAKLVAGTFDGKIYTSIDSGANWTSNAAPTQSRYSLASSADGTKLVAAPLNGQIYVSADSGVSWTPCSAPNTYWISVAASADGTKLAAAWTINNSGGIYTSTNAGTTWTAKNLPSLQWYSVASSADGNRLVAVSHDPAQIYTSTDSGNTWVSNSIAIGYLEYLNTVASSADGCRLVAGTFGSYAYVSTNSGKTWSSSDSPPVTWNSITSSADGAKLAAIVLSWPNNTAIYTWQSTPSPSLVITPGITNLILSWTLPSMSFVLQQSPDLVSWVNVTNTPTLNLTNLQDEVTLALSNSSSFYRLKTP